MTRSGTEDTIYVVTGDGSNRNLYKYSISANSWTTLAASPVATGDGNSIIRSGTEDTIYVVSGNGTTSFRKYTISTNAWAGAVPTPVYMGVMLRNGSDDTIYVLPANGTAAFYKYSISGSSWTTLASAPGVISLEGSHMIRNGSDNDIYVLPAGGSNLLYKYSISSNSWTTLTAAPGAIGSGAGIIRNGGDNDIYVLQGNSGVGFYKYSISANSWTSLAGFPPGTRWGKTHMIRNGAEDTIYATAGNYSTGFYKYTISTNTWTALTSAPAALNDASLLRNGADDTIYVTQGQNSGFYKYSISGNSWTTLTAVPGYVNPGNTAIRNGSEDYIYLAHNYYGGGDFSRYSISANTWTSLVKAPNTIGMLIRNGADNDFYAMDNRNGTGFYKYTINSVSYASSATYTSGVIDIGAAAATWGNLTWTSSGGQTISMKIRTGASASDVTTAAWGGATTISGASLASLGAQTGHRYIQYQATLSTANPSQTPSLNDVTIAYTYYGSSGPLVLLHFEDGTGALTTGQTILDSSGYNNNATSGSNTASFQSSGKIRQSMYFGNYLGANNFINRPLSSFTLAAWFKTNSTSTTNQGTILAIGRYDGSTQVAQSGVGLYGGTVQARAVKDGSYSWGTLSTATSTYNDNNWHYAAMTFDNASSIANLYVDGQLASSMAVTADFNQTISTYRVGGGTGAHWGGFNGTSNELDEVAIYPRALSASEIASHYNAGNPSAIIGGNYLLSSAYDSGQEANTISGLKWRENAALPAGASVGVALRSASTSVSLATAAWMGNITSATTGCTKDGAGLVTCTSDALPASFASSTGNRWVQYLVSLTSDGLNTPTVSEVDFVYVVNATPEFDPTASTTASQIASSTDPDWGKVRIAYSVRDTDTDTGTTQPGYVSPSFEYNIGSGWQPIATSSLAAGNTDNKIVLTTGYTAYTATWNAADQIPGQYITTAQVRVTVNDREAAANTAQASTAEFTLDTKAPTASVFPLDAIDGTLSYTATDDLSVSYRISNNSDLSYDNMNAGSGSWTDAATTSVSASTTWTFTGDPSHQTVYFQARDPYGNAVTAVNTAPMRPSNFDIKDISNPATSDFREFLSWKSFTATTSSNFSRYEVWRNENGGAFSLYHTIATAQGGPGLNYFTDAIVASSTTYAYKLRVIDTDGDISPWASNIPSDLPDGQGGTDPTAPTITSPLLAERQTTWAKVTFTTDELAFGSVTYKKSDGSGLTTASSTSLGTDHVVVLPNLDSGTDYLYKIVARDVVGNESTLDNGGAWYAFTTKSGPKISDVTVTLADDKNATIVWNTDTDSNSSITYATSITTLNSATGTVVTATSLVGGPPYQHKITLSGLVARTTYWFSVSSTDSDNNTTIDKNNLAYYSFTTSYDQKPPVISDISVPVSAPNAIVVYWKTDELADAKLLVGTASSTYATTSWDTVMSITHAVAMSGLTANTTYHYQVRSCDPVGNCTDSADRTVKTAKDGEVTIVTVGGGGAGAGQFTEPPTPKDTTPPVISNIQVATTTAFSATITFDTNEATRTFLNHGTSASYDRVTGDSNPQLNHEVRLSGLRAGTEYHFRISALDASGNEALSEDRTFTTKFISERAEALKTLENISQYEQEVEDSIESILPSIFPPFVESPQISDVTENSAVVVWRTNVKAYGVVAYATDAEFSTSTAYTSEVSDITTKTREHTLNLVGLKPNTKYHLKARSFSLPQVVGESKDLTFSTKAPKVSASVVDVKNTSFRVVWTTDEPATTIVEYKDVRRGGIQRKIDESQRTDHDLAIENLIPATTYEVRVFGYNANGNYLESKDPITVTTRRDVTPPKISNFKVDGALVPGRTDRIQTIVTWVTDEPSTSIVEYQEGAGSVADGFANKVEVTDSFVQNHVVILANLKPGTIYQFRITSVDQAGNKSSFGPRTIITPQKGESIFDVIFKNFEDTFKFLRGAGQ